jgi:eukaryotic-like serine/threonine-protein kinase
MAVGPGTRVGPYEILSAIGAGGMGEVYRARDAKLGRDVALKVLPEAFARDAERMARFQREAKVLASLNHPNIASIYGLEDSGTTHALVMELVEGPTLADRLKSGPIPISEALPIAKQICEALEYAHERGIVHRDLKPANVKVTPDDVVKILDFGLAKALEGDASSIDISTSPTISRLATQAGVLLGTAAYMSPEQAKGKAVDRRADIWAFGCVLYEMLTGKMAFGGESVTDTLASVIKEEPDWSLLPAATPIRVRVLLQRCLQKDPKQRLQAIGDARISLDEVLTGALDPTLAGTLQPAAPAWQRMLPWVIAALLFVTLGPIAFLYFRPKPFAPAAPVQRFEIEVPDPSVQSVGALSPDGTQLILQNGLGNAQSGLWLRRMDSLETRPIEGTEGAYGIPFWSPDSRFIAFSTTDGKLKKVDAQGGPAQVLCDSVMEVNRGFWTPDGKIVFSDPRRPPFLWEVPAAGGVSVPLPGVESPGRGAEFYGPMLLPDGKHFLYSIGGAASPDVYLASLDSPPGQQTPRKLLTGVISSVVYAPSLDDRELGYLLFVGGAESSIVAGPLMAQPIDLRKLKTAGEPVLIAEQVAWYNFSASLTGTLVYLSGGTAGQQRQVTIFDRKGKILGMAGEPANYQFGLAFSPDGRRVVAARDKQSGGTNLWMMDLARGISTRFTFDSGDDVLPAWSPDGSRVTFASDRGGQYQIYQRLSNGGGDDELLFKSDSGVAAPLSWSGDGRFLLIASSLSIPDPSAAVLPLDEKGHAAGKPFVFVQKGVGIDLKFSPGPQGHPLWVAYASNESGKFEIYVRPFDPNSPTGTPPGGGKWQVSTQGGVSPRWNGNGKELFYVAPDGTVMSVEVSGSHGMFQSGVPKPLFKSKVLAQENASYFDWDASSDGTKFIFPEPPSASGPAPRPRFTVVLNWQAGLKK